MIYLMMSAENPITLSSDLESEFTEDGNGLSDDNIPQARFTVQKEQVIEIDSSASTSSQDLSEDSDASDHSSVFEMETVSATMWHGSGPSGSGPSGSGPAGSTSMETMLSTPITKEGSRRRLFDSSVLGKGSRSSISSLRRKRRKRSWRDSSSDSDTMSRSYSRPKSKKNKGYYGLPRDGTTSESEIGTPVKKQGRTDVVSDSELSSPVKRKVEHLHGNRSIPIYDHTSKHYTAKTIVEVLLDKHLPFNRIATCQPVGVQDNLVFVIDLSKLEKPEDVRADDLGSWTCNGKRCVQCVVHDGEVSEVIPGSKSGTCKTYCLVKRYYKHATSGDFKRTIAEIYDPSGDQLNRAFVQYTFNNKPHPIIQKPHGNTKNAHAQPFIRTTPSTLQKLKQCIQVQPPKQAVASVTKQKGGIIKLNAVGDLPRNRKQAYNITSKKSGEGDDALLSVMAMCKLSMGKGDDPFVRIVTSAPEPMCVLSTNSQLFDIERFCTDPGTFTPLSVDPTFDLGDFSVTVTSYRNLLLKNRTTGQNPVMIGPMLVHRRKLFSSYHFFASSLVSLKPSVSHLQAFGTDGEENLFSAFSAQFSNAKHLRCFLHFRDNCKAKLQQMSIQNDTILEILQDILGSFLKGKEGLVDALDCNALRDRLQSLKSKWESQAPGFYEWFIEHKLPAVESSMLRSVRQAAGLGNPPDQFYTNDIESINRVIKRKTDYKTSEWPDFCRLSKELVDDQESETEKAVIGIGEYRFDDEYVHLEIPLAKWSSMTQNQRKKHLERIRNLTLQEAKEHHKKKSSSNSTIEKASSSDKSLTICGKHFNVGACQLSGDILKNMFNKAEKLVCGQNTICPSPGSVNAKLVESKSGKRPHFVVKKASSKYNCDSDCPMWKCSKLCSHTIACAYQDGCLQEFLSQATSAPSFYALSKASTTTKAGKKPQKRKASSKSSTKTFAELREEISQPESVAPHSHDYPVTCTSHIHSSQPATSVFQCPSISLSQSCRSASSTVVQGPTVSTSSQTTRSAIGSQSHHLGLASTSLIQSPTVSITQTHTPCVSVNRSKIFTLSQPSMIQSPLISVSQTSGQETSVPFSTVGTTQSISSSIQNSSSVSTSTSSLPLSALSVNNLLSTLVSQMLAHPSSSASVAGLVQNPQSMMQAPQSTVPQSPVQTSQTDLFWVMMISGNISRCQGCSGKILRGGNGKPLPPPDDLVVQHKEHVLFQNPRSGVFQLSHDLRNVYYHPRLSCIRRKFLSFQPGQQLRISKEALSKLTNVHKDHILKEFGIKFIAK